MIVTKKEPDVRHWGTKEFISYYMAKYRDLRNDQTYIFPNEVWLYYGVHIKRFMLQMKLTSAEYKKFIDWVFSKDFLKGRKLVGFIAIVNKDVFYAYMRITGNKKHVVKELTTAESEQIKNNLLASKELFPEK